MRRRPEYIILTKCIWVLTAVKYAMFFFGIASIVIPLLHYWGVVPLRQAIELQILNLLLVEHVACPGKRYNDFTDKRMKELGHGR